VERSNHPRHPGGPKSRFREPGTGGMDPPLAAAALDRDSLNLRSASSLAVSLDKDCLNLCG